MTCINGPVHRGHRYSRRRVNGRLEYGHVLAWEEEHGPVPEGLELHHTCENKACVNVAHLVAVSRADHQRLHWKAKCKKGLHVMAGDNIIWGRGVRMCRACRNAYAREYRARKKAAA